MKKYLKHIKFFGFVFLIAVIMALLEIQIEGPNGWAAQLPTWRTNIHIPAMGMWQGYRGKPLTGYHVYLWLFSFLLPHVIFLYTKWNWKKEANLISFYIFFSTFEGLLWFILNPAWGWHKFRYGIPWYKEAWVLGLPAEYWLRFGVASVLYYFSQKDANPKDKAE
jgi:hypothetical protein